MYNCPGESARTIQHRPVNQLGHKQCLWPAINSDTTNLVLGLDKAGLRLVIGFITARLGL